MPIININVPVTKKIYSVSELNRQSKNLLEAKFSGIQIEGEISNLSTPASGHIYFKLKDTNAQIQCALFRSRAMKLHFTLEEGMHVILNASVSMYEARGDYQLIVDHVELAGEGLLRLQFEALKHKLQAQGLFAAEHKQSLPTLPKAIGLITSPTGAAIQDAVSTLKIRFPAIPIYVYPAQVQGSQAAPQIAQQIQLANQHRECDVLLVIRGGGSLEDLWPFNEEIVAHAIFQSKLPIVSGVGHETDITLADYCADHRAATPTAAATIVTPHQDDILQYIKSKQLLLLSHIHKTIQQLSQQSHHLSQRLRTPQQLINQRQLHINALTSRLNKILLQQWYGKQMQLQHLLQRLQSQNLLAILQKKQLCVNNLHHRLTNAIAQQSMLYQQKFKTLCTLLQATSPLATIERGYSLSYQKDKTLISSINQVKKQDTFLVEVKDGQILAQAIELLEK